MDMSGILKSIDAEIDKLQKARQLLSDSESAVSPVTRNLEREISGKRRGRPPGSGKAAETSVVKRVMSEEGRARIAAAQKKRWAASKKAVKGSAASVRAGKVGAPQKHAAVKNATAPAKKTAAKAAPVKSPASKKAVAKTAPKKKEKSEPKASAEVLSANATQVPAEGNGQAAV